MKKLLATNAVPYSSPLSSRLNCPRDSAFLKLQERLFQRMAPLKLKLFL